MKSQLFLPIAEGRIAFSTRLLSIRVVEWYWGATETFQGLSSYEHTLQLG